MWFLSFIPFVGKIVDAWSAHDQKKLDVGLEKYRVDGQIDVAAMDADVKLIQAQKELRLADKGDPVVRAAVGLFLIPSGVWYAAVMWDSTFRNLVPSLTWRVLDPPAAVWQILLIIVGYLFLHTVKQAWRK